MYRYVYFCMYMLILDNKGIIIALFNEKYQPTTTI